MPLDMRLGRIIDTATQPQIYYLKAGELHVAAKSSRIVTVLGSCIAVCLWDRKRRIGGMNHYLMPQCFGNLQKNTCGEMAIDNLVRAMRRAGSDDKDMVAQVYGGGRVLDYLSSFTVPEDNAKMAFKMLARYNIPVEASDTCNPHGLRIEFDTGAGTVTRSVVNPLSLGLNKAS